MAVSARHILVVDDDREISELVGELLTKEGYKVSRAFNAAQARQKLDREKIDLIVLDLMLPGTDGLTLCRELRASGLTTSIIMLTEKGDDFDRVLGLEMGADDYLPKPFHSREILARSRPCCGEAQQEGSLHRPPQERSNGSKTMRKHFVSTGSSPWIRG